MEHGRTTTLLSCRYRAGFTSESQAHDTASCFYFLILYSSSERYSQWKKGFESLLLQHQRIKQSASLQNTRSPINILLSEPINERKDSRGKHSHDREDFFAPFKWDFLLLSICADNFTCSNKIQLHSYSLLSPSLCLSVTFQPLCNLLILFYTV